MVDADTDCFSFGVVDLVKIVCRLKGTVLFFPRAVLLWMVVCLDRLGFLTVSWASPQVSRGRVRPRFRINVEIEAVRLK